MSVLGTSRWVTDGGLETDLSHHRGVELPDFAAFPLLEEPDGLELLAAWFAGYADIARRAGAGLLLEGCTWRANPDWGARLGYDAARLDRVNRSAIRFLHEQRERHRDVGAVLVGGTVGPRGDGYVPGERLTPERYADYHRPQLASFRAADADLVTAYTLTGVDEAIGIVWAARDEGLPVAVSFTVELDGRLADGTTVREAVERTDEVAAPDWYLLNCAHPTAVALALDADAWTDRLRGLRPNASRLSHAELDASEVLDEGDPVELRDSLRALPGELAAPQVLGGCCGTDARHVASLWGA